MKNVILIVVALVGISVGCNDEVKKIEAQYQKVTFETFDQTKVGQKIRLLASVWRVDENKESQVFSSEFTSRVRDIILSPTLGSEPGLVARQVISGSEANDLSKKLIVGQKIEIFGEIQRSNPGSPVVVLQYVDVEGHFYVVCNLCDF